METFVIDPTSLFTRTEYSRGAFPNHRPTLGLRRKEPEKRHGGFHEIDCCNIGLKQVVQSDCLPCLRGCSAIRRSPARRGHSASTQRRFSTLPSVAVPCCSRSNRLTAEVTKTFASKFGPRSNPKPDLRWDSRSMRANLSSMKGFTGRESQRRPRK